MKFNKWSQTRRELGIKQLTSRTKAYTDDKDVEYVTPPLPWWFIKKFLWKSEGAFSPEELQRVINQIHRRKVSPDKMFYVHVLTKLERK